MSIWRVTIVPTLARVLLGPPASERSSRTHALTYIWVRYRLRGREEHVRVPAQAPFHPRGGEVLTVLPQPVVSPTGEVEVAVGVAIGEITRPVPPVLRTLAIGLTIVVVA